MSELGELLIKNVRVLARLKPDFIYDKHGTIGGCFYVHKGQPSCLVGHALWNVGLIGPEIEGTARNCESIDMMAAKYLGGIDDDELWWLNTVQDLQDSGRSWASAVDRADG